MRRLYCRVENQSVMTSGTIDHSASSTTEGAFSARVLIEPRPPRLRAAGGGGAAIWVLMGVSPP